MEVGGGTRPTSAATASSVGGGTSKSMSVFVWQASDMKEYRVNKTVKVAIGLLVLAFLFIIIAFSTPAWLETDGYLENPKFVRIGKSILV